MGNQCSQFESPLARYRRARSSTVDLIEAGPLGFTSASASGPSSSRSSQDSGHGSGRENGKDSPSSPSMNITEGKKTYRLRRSGCIKYTNGTRKGSRSILGKSICDGFTRSSRTSLPTDIPIISVTKCPTINSIPMATCVENQTGHTNWPLRWFHGWASTGSVGTTERCKTATLRVLADDNGRDQVETANTDADWRLNSLTWCDRVKGPAAAICTTARRETRGYRSSPKQSIDSGVCDMWAAPLSSAHYQNNTTPNTPLKTKNISSSMISINHKSHPHNGNDDSSPLPGLIITANSTSRRSGRPLIMAHCTNTKIRPMA